MIACRAQTRSQAAVSYSCSGPPSKSRTRLLDPQLHRRFSSAERPLHHRDWARLGLDREIALRLRAGGRALFGPVRDGDRVVPRDLERCLQLGAVVRGRYEAVRSRLEPRVILAPVVLRGLVARDLEGVSHDDLSV